MVVNHRYKFYQKSKKIQLNDYRKEIQMKTTIENKSHKKWLPIIIVLDILLIISLAVTLQAKIKEANATAFTQNDQVIENTEVLSQEVQDLVQQYNQTVMDEISYMKAGLTLFTAALFLFLLQLVIDWSKDRKLKKSNELQN